MAYKWFSAPTIPLLEGSSLASTLENNFGEYEVEVPFVRVKSGGLFCYIQTKASTYGPLAEAWATIGLAPLSEARFSVAVRANGISDFYAFYIKRNGEWFILKIVSGVETTLASGVFASELEVGDRIAVRAVGTEIACAVQHAGIIFVVHETTDSELTGAGAVDFSLKESGSGVVEFGGGTPETKSPPPTGQSSMVV